MFKPYPLYKPVLFTLMASNILISPMLYAQQDSSSNTISDQAESLPVIQVHAQDKQDNQKEIRGYAAKKVSIGLGHDPHDLKEIPNSVTVLTRERLDDLNAVNIANAMEYTPGVKVTTYGTTSAQVESRGYGIDHYQIDGISSSSRTYEASLNNLAMYDRIEVMRGVSGLLQGTGDPGGTINFVRKRALDHYALNAKTSIGSWNNYYADVDITGPLNQDASLRGRMVVSYQDRDYFIDEASKKLPTFYGTLEYDIDSNTTLSIGTSYQRSKDRPFYGLPAYANGSLPQVSRSTYVGADWNNAVNESSRSFIELKHHLTSGGTLKLSGSYLYQNNHSEFEWANSYIDTAGHFALIPYFSFSQNQEANINAEMTQPFLWHDLKQEVVVGANYQKYTSKSAYNGSTWGQNGSTQNIFDPDYAIAAPDISIDDPDTTTQIQKSIYAQARMKPTNPLTVILGGRLAQYETKNQLYAYSNQKINSKFVPYAGLVYDLTKNVAAYASYSNIFSPQTNRTKAQTFVKPREGDQFEVGLKADYFDQRLISTLALYQIKDRNRAITDPSDSNYALAAGEVKSKGVEIELTGNITDQWKILAGYSYNTAIQVKAAEGEEGVRLNPYFPRNIFTLWNDYQFKQGILHHLSLGLGYRYRSNIYSTNNSIIARQGGFSLFDIQAAYQFTPQIKASITVKNLLDKVYYDRPEAWTRQNYFGEPRSVMFTLSYRSN